MNEQDISKAVEAVLGQMNGQHAHHAAGHVCKCKKHVMTLKLANALIEKVKAYAEEMGIEAQISMEERMACGIGACLGCVCQSKEVDDHSHVHNKRVCKDGPVFLATEVEL